MPSLERETIVAVATPTGVGAISVVRLSGPESLSLVQPHLQSVRGSLQPRRATLTRFVDQDGRLVDQVLVTFFPAPYSYTGEDVVEISCHGSLALTRWIVELLLQEGARLARPGEFTMRAFLAGKMDLAQAEAVRDLVASQTLFQAQVAQQQLRGSLSQSLQPLKSDLIDVISHLETSLEFVEDEVEPEGREALLLRLGRVGNELGKMIASYRWGRLIQEGLVVTITGKPNAGKSSIFNCLLKRNRAIVTPFPGTTRDAVAESISLEGVPVRLVDTAGIREAGDPVEHLGIEKSLEFLRSSDLILMVMDLSVPSEEEDWRIWELVREQEVLLVLNKRDLPRRLQVPSEMEAKAKGVVEVSALHGEHLEELTAKILGAIFPPEGLEVERVVVTNLRHRECLEKARAHLEKGMEAYRQGLSEEFVLHDLRRSLDALGEVTGETSVDDILERIFSTFCIGK